MCLPRGNCGVSSVTYVGVSKSTHSTFLVLLTVVVAMWVGSLKKCKCPSQLYIAHCTFLVVSMTRVTRPQWPHVEVKLKSIYIILIALSFPTFPHHPIFPLHCPPSCSWQNHAHTPTHHFQRLSTHLKEARDHIPHITVHVILKYNPSPFHT
jgi:hypothetical protein